MVQEVFVGGGPVVAPFIGLPGFSFFFGGQPAPPPPPPVVVVPEPMYAYPPGPVVAGPPPQPSPPPQQVIDPLTEPLARLKSLHGNSRRDGCLEMGSLKDPGRSPRWVERLEHDFDKEVRVAAAWALGEIGDNRAAVPLERAAQFDKRQDVRTAAKAAYGRLTKPGQVPTESPSMNPTGFRPPVGPDRQQARRGLRHRSAAPARRRLPAPPPTPATGPTVEGPRGQE